MHQIEMVDKNLRMASATGRQENGVKDRERIDEAPVKSHDTEDQEVLIAWDNVSGARLNPELVKEARKAEMEYFRKMGLSTKVSKKRCYDVTGNKGKDPDLYTATPPLDLLRMLMSLAASRKGESGGRWKFMVSGVSRVFFYAPSLKPTFVEICP